MKIGFLHSILDGMFIELSCCCCGCCCCLCGNRLNNLNIKIVSNLHAPPAAAAAATAAAATWLTTATIANQIKQLSCYEQKRGRLQPHQVARLTNKRELGVNPGIQGSMEAWCISSLPIKIYKNSSHLVLAKTLALAKRQRRCIGAVRKQRQHGYNKCKVHIVRGHKARRVYKVIIMPGNTLKMQFIASNTVL